jgi:hypothetical protein
MGRNRFKIPGGRQPRSYPHTGLAKINLPQADFWPGTTSGLTVIQQLSGNHVPQADLSVLIRSVAIWITCGSPTNLPEPSFALLTAHS